MELKDIKGIGAKKLIALNSEGIYTVKDLMLSYPKEYYIYEASDEAFNMGENTLITSKVLTTPIITKFRSRSYIVIFYVDYKGFKLKCACFSGEYLRYKLFKGSTVNIYGRYSKLNKEFIVSKVFFNELENLVEVDYKYKAISNSSITSALKILFSGNVIVSETLPIELLEKYKLLNIKDYIYKSHFPINKEDVRQVLRRRKYEEFYWYSMRLEALKDLRISEDKKPRVIDNKLINDFLNDIPFKLTKDQLNALSLIKKDVLSNKVMNRLLQGDVGSGKSIVSFIFALMLISSGYQVAMMIPSELLANQQYQEALKYFNKYKISIELLTSKTKLKDKDDILDRIYNGRVDLIIGTHSLIDEKVVFKNLGGIIIDEQHRFGVEQRNKLINKFKGVDALYMSATPIPRSLGLTIFGDLDISSIHQKPSGRIDIITKVFDYSKIDMVVDLINKEIALNHQIYIVVPMVEENDALDIMTINKCSKLFKSKLPDAKIGVVHGKLLGNKKSLIMDEFNCGNLDILISTTVIEVGMNVKNATMMVIMDAERFGLATLHQLRGRVGRSNLKSYCYLLSKELDNPRLNVIEKENDGFIIAEEDFKLRGPGDYIGNNQSGYLNFNYSSFLDDINIWNCAKEDSEIYFTKYKEGLEKSKIFDEIVDIEKKNAGKLS